MTKGRLAKYVSQGNEIEFVYKEKNYSITYATTDGVDCISFCEFYSDTLDVPDVDTLWDSEYHGMAVSDIISSLTIYDMWIY